jgi:hypothetical protein
MTRQIERKHVATVVREIPRLQRPHPVIVSGAVREHDRRQRGIETPRAGVGVDVRRSDSYPHGASCISDVISYAGDVISYAGDVISYASDVIPAQAGIQRSADLSPQIAPFRISSLD